MTLGPPRHSSLCIQCSRVTKWYNIHNLYPHLNGSKLCRGECWGSFLETCLAHILCVKTYVSDHMPTNRGERIILKESFLSVFILIEQYYMVCLIAQNCGMNIKLMPTISFLNRIFWKYITVNKSLDTIHLISMMKAPRNPKIPPKRRERERLKLHLWLLLLIFII